MYDSVAAYCPSDAVPGKDKTLSQLLFKGLVQGMIYITSYIVYITYMDTLALDLLLYGLQLETYLYLNGINTGNCYLLIILY